MQPKQTLSAPDAHCTTALLQPLGTHMVSLLHSLFAPQRRPPPQSLLVSSPQRQPLGTTVPLPPQAGGPAGEREEEEAAERSRSRKDQEGGLDQSRQEHEDHCAEEGARHARARPKLPMHGLHTRAARTPRRRARRLSSRPPQEAQAEAPHQLPQAPAHQRLLQHRELRWPQLRHAAAGAQAPPSHPATADTVPRKKSPPRKKSSKPASHGRQPSAPRPGRRRPPGSARPRQAVACPGPGPMRPSAPAHGPNAPSHSGPEP
mmetsp:Transcript_65718/g.203743  ORF Transcript_65718/g.203743 Transcript_65718/m.203743 type:complete len:261 (-) Transcript_65718:11-793(-)